MKEVGGILNGTELSDCIEDIIVSIFRYKRDSSSLIVAIVGLEDVN